MSLTLGIWDYVVIVLMLAISAVIGVYFRFTGGRQKTIKEFLMADKDMAVLPVAFSLMATYMSAISVLGIPSEVYLYGIQTILFLVGVPVGGVIAAYLLLPVFFDMEACTAYEYLEKRFGKTTRSIVSMLFILQMILYMSVVLYAPSIALNTVTGLSTWASITTLAVVCTFYCSLGGLKAVLWTDVFQALLMYLTIIAVVVQASIRLGGLSNLMHIADDGGRLFMFEITPSLTVRYTFWNSLTYGVIFALSTFGTNQAQIQRMLSVRSLKRAQRALLLSIPLILFFSFFCVWDGVAIFSLFHDCDPILDPFNATITAPDQLMPYSILNMFSHFPAVSGLCICGVFGASLSTISSAVNSMTAVTIEDFIKPYCTCRKLTEAWATFLAKILAIAYGGLCLLLTVVVANFRGILEASNIMMSLVGGPVLGVFLLGMFTTRANERGTLSGLLMGFAVNGWLGFGSYASKLNIPKLPRRIDGCDGYLLANDTYYGDVTTLASTDAYPTDDPFNDVEQQNEHVFILYRISYVWFSFFGALSTFALGYICSFIEERFAGPKPVPESLITPILRKCFFHNKRKENKFQDHISLAKLQHPSLSQQ